MLLKCLFFLLVLVGTARAASNTTSNSTLPTSSLTPSPPLSPSLTPSPPPSPSASPILGCTDTAMTALQFLKETHQEFVKALHNSAKPEIFAWLNERVVNGANKSVPLPFTIFVTVGDAGVDNATADQLMYRIVPNTILVGPYLDDNSLYLTLYNVSENKMQQRLRIGNDGKGTYSVAGGAPTKFELGTYNGSYACAVIHTITEGAPAVNQLLPPPTLDFKDDDLAFLRQAVLLTNLTIDDKSQKFTVLAPIDAAFRSLPTPLFNFLVLNTNKSNTVLHYVLSNHINTSNAEDAGPFYAIPRGTKFPTGNNKYQTLYKVLNESYYMVHQDKAVVGEADVMVTTNNRLAANGVFHTVDTVLLDGIDVNSQVDVIDIFTALSNDSRFLAFMKESAPLELQELFYHGDVTLFVPTDAAFDNVADQDALNANDSRREILFSHLVPHVVFNPLLLNTLGNYVVGTAVDNATVLVLNVTKVGEGQLSLAGHDGSAKLTLMDCYMATGLPRGTVCTIDRVLGEAQKKPTDDDSGLTSTEIGLIVAGAIVAVLLVGAAIGGGVWYFKRRHGYEQIDGDTTY